MVNALAREFHTASLLRFALPTVLMNLFVGLYYIVDGVCVARFASTDALSAMNITYPTFFTALAISIMLATGGSAVVAKKWEKGMGKKRAGIFLSWRCLRSWWDWHSVLRALFLSGRCFISWGPAMCSIL